MISQKVQIDLQTSQLAAEALNKGAWLAILHAQRTPPHVGLIFSGFYSSLTIKERELDLRAEVLIKTITQKHIESIFLKVVPHPVFSIEHQKEMFTEHLMKYTKVKQNESTCLTPVKNFFNEFYALNSNENELLYDFVKKLSENHFIEKAALANVNFENGIELPHYSTDELNERIRKERSAYYKD
jgi:hypothetical protein